VSKGPQERNKTLPFENVAGSTMPALLNAFGSARRMTLALGTDDLAISTRGALTWRG